MTTILIWAIAGLLIHVGVALLDQRTIDLHLPVSWRTFIVWVPMSMMFGPLMILGVLITPPRLPWER